jgi:hypothetical protein
LLLAACPVVLASVHAGTFLPLVSWQLPLVSTMSTTLILCQYGMLCPAQTLELLPISHSSHASCCAWITAQMLLFTLAHRMSSQWLLIWLQVVALAATIGLDLGTTLLFTGLYNIASGLGFRIPMCVQPMKTIAAVALAAPGRLDAVLHLQHLYRACQ